MRFTSLIVELVRARPKLIVWVAILVQFALWVLLPTLIYASPPAEIATVLAYGREYQTGTDLGPPLPFWLADIAFRAAGNHVFGVYLLSGLCFIVTMWALFQLGSAIVGRQQAALAVMLTATITVFGYPGIVFGPEVLARPLWALVLLHAWRVAGQGRRAAWFALSIESGLLLLTTHAAVLLLVLLLVFLLATARGRRALRSADPWYALAVIVVMTVPYVTWVVRFAPPEPPLPPFADLGPHLLRWGGLIMQLLLAMVGIAILVALNTRRFMKRPDNVPLIFRAPVNPFARRFVLVFAAAPPLLAALVSALFGFNGVFGGAGTVLLMFGLAVIVLAPDLIPLRRQETLRTVWGILIAAPAVVVLAMVLIRPWVSTEEVATSLPARDIGKFVNDSFERRTGQPLRAVAGDPQLAMLVALTASHRPHVFFDESPQRTPWIDAKTFRATGGIVVWRAADTAGTPPPEIARQFPDVAPELPRAFERVINGRQPLFRLGWGIVRPQTK
jgi:4-amino-4-deoxy-L-arabinose transferase-like glycosyltransferase